MGYASSIAWVLFTIITALTLVAFWSSRKWVYYAGDKRS
jgi:oligogalacturonide transport system permease protein